MSFKIDYSKRVANLLGLSTDEVKELLKRLEGHYKKHGVTKFEIARSFFVLRDIFTRKQIQKLEQSAPNLGFKHRGLIAYKKEIVHMVSEGFGSQKIYYTLQHKKDAPSLATIKRYVKAYIEWRSLNG